MRLLRGMLHDMSMKDRLFWVFGLIIATVLIVLATLIANGAMDGYVQHMNPPSIPANLAVIVTAHTSII